MSEAGDALELSSVVGDECSIECECVGGDESVERADGGSLLLQGIADDAVVADAFDGIEGK